MVKLIRDVTEVPEAAKKGVITLGNFDGVHIGHQALLRMAVNEAKSRGVASTVLTFEPHPFEYFKRGNIPRITRLREKITALAAEGIDYIIILKFNQELATLSASDFVMTKLVDCLHPSHIIVGDDFRFGKGREGDAALLNQIGLSHGFSVTRLPTLMLDNERVSSTRVRAALQQADLSLAAQLLGRPYTMQGRVRHGDKRGRSWGFPTANIFLHRTLTPITGVFTVTVLGLDGIPLQGVANIGTRPTVGGTKTLLEVHLFDFDRDIYGCYVEVVFHKKLRDEVRFADFDALKKQIHQDVIAAKKYFGV